MISTFSQLPVILCLSSSAQSQNLIMLQHLSDIARSKRINDGNTKKMHWKDFYLQIVVNPRYVLCFLLRQQLVYSSV